jgi:hypothetical protein
MVRGVSREVYDAAGEPAELELLVIPEVDIEAVLGQCRVVETIHGREGLLHLCNTRADTYRYMSSETALQILR